MSRVLARTPDGAVTVSEAAIGQIVGGAIASVEGARLRKGRRRLGLELADGRARAELDIGVSYGLVLPDVARAVQERVAEALAQACETTVDGVDVTVVELYG